MVKHYGRILVGALLVASPSTAWAQQGEQGEEAGPASAQQQLQRPTIEAIVRGFYVEARVGGGYTVAQQNLEPTPNFPTLSGSEGFGTALLLQANIGYDITDFLAFELVGGASFLSSTRRDRVRELGIYYGGAAIRGSYGFTDRLLLLVSAGAGFGRADNAVDPPEDGLVVLGNLGLEYYVHVRHFSIGLVASAVAPLSPLRVAVGLSPQIKYTF